jgi:hypothetical protein
MPHEAAGTVTPAMAAQSQLAAVEATVHPPILLCRPTSNSDFWGVTSRMPLSPPIPSDHQGTLCAVAAAAHSVTGCGTWAITASPIKLTL